MVDILSDNPDTDDDDGQPGYEENGQPEDFRLIIGAPDFTTLIKTRKTKVSREYETKTASALKAVAIGSIQTNNLPDAAAVFWHGPAMAGAVGTLADTDERVRKAIDMLTSPSSPWLALAATALPLVAQLMRNHEQELKDVPGKLNMRKKAREARKQSKADTPQEKPLFVLHLGRRKIPVRVKFRFAKTFFAGLRSQTQYPDQITAAVFGDPDMQKALEKLNIYVKVSTDG